MIFGRHPMRTNYKKSSVHAYKMFPQKVSKLWTILWKTWGKFLSIVKWKMHMSVSHLSTLWESSHDWSVNKQSMTYVCVGFPYFKMRNFVANPLNCPMQTTVLDSIWVNIFFIYYIIVNHYWSLNILLQLFKALHCFMPICVTSDAIFSQVSFVIETWQTNVIDVITTNVVVIRSDCPHCVIYPFAIEKRVFIVFLLEILLVDIFSDTLSGLVIIVVIFDVRLHFQSQANEFCSYLTCCLVLYFADNFFICIIVIWTLFSENTLFTEIKLFFLFPEILIDIRCLNLIAEWIRISEQQLSFFAVIIFDIVIMEIIHQRFANIKYANINVGGLVKSKRFF